MGDILGVLLTVLLLAANAFFVAAEFALISARRDRLQALAEQGKRSAVTVIRAGEHLSLDAGRIPAGHHDLLDPVGPGRRARRRAPAGEAVRIGRGVRHRPAHGLVRRRAGHRGDPARTARRDGAEEHRHRGPSRPLRCCWSRRIWSTSARPGRSSRSTTGAPTSPCGLSASNRRTSCNPAVSTVELSEMIAESVSEGLLDTEEHGRLDPGAADPQPHGRAMWRCR